MHCFFKCDFFHRKLLQFQQTNYWCHCSRRFCVADTIVCHSLVLTKGYHFSPAVTHPSTAWPYSWSNVLAEAYAAGTPWKTQSLVPYLFLFITYPPPFIWVSFTELGLHNVDVAESLQVGTERALLNIGCCLLRFVRFIRAAENCFAWCV